MGITNISATDITTRMLMASLNNLQSIPMKAVMSNQDLEKKLLEVVITLKVENPELGRYINVLT